MHDNKTETHSWPYFMAIIFMALLGVGSILYLTHVRPHEDNTVLITLILGFLAPTTLSLLSMMKAHEAAAQAKATHGIVNAELDAWKKNFQALAFAEGKEAGIAAERLLALIQAPKGAVPVKEPLDDQP